MFICGRIDFYQRDLLQPRMGLALSTYDSSRQDGFPCSNHCASPVALLILHVCFVHGHRLSAQLLCSNKTLVAGIMLYTC